MTPNQTNLLTALQANCTVEDLHEAYPHLSGTDINAELFRLEQQSYVVSEKLYRWRERTWRATPQGKAKINERLYT
jgi:hypothetical protein